MNKKINIFLDDERDPPRQKSQWDAGDTEWVLCRTAKEAIELIKTGNVGYITFDHDLGFDEDGNEVNGADVAKLIEKMAYRRELEPIDYRIHSGNPVGADNIDKAMKSAYRFWREQGLISR